MSTAIALLIARLVAGLGLASHGSQKLFGWFGGSGPQGIGGYFRSLGFPAPVALAVLAGLGEFVGGLLLALGWLGAIGPALIISVMLVASVSEHLPHGFYSYNGGYELPSMYAMIVLIIAFVGPGSLALDSLIGVPALGYPTVAVILILAGIAGGGVTLLLRHAPAPSGDKS
ncbi:DoxX family protein [bacterium]|nr:MAG: DoxX family protein [bacterium]